MYFILPDMNRIAKIIDKRCQLVDLLRIRVVVGTVHKRQFLPEIVLCHRLVGKQHKIFDNLGCNIALVRLDLHRASLRVQNDLRLREIKINRSALHPFFAENRRQIPHPLKHWHKLLILTDLRLIVILQDLFDTGVTHAAVDLNDCLRNHVIDHISLRIHGHDTA